MNTARIDIRCNEQQKRLIEQHAEQSGMTQTEFMLYAADRLIAERKQKAQERKDKS